MYQEQGEAFSRVIFVGQLVDVVIFSTSAQTDRVVVEGFWVRGVHVGRDQKLWDTGIEAYPISAGESSRFPNQSVSNRNVRLGS